jgi:hypothetical protein
MSCINVEVIKSIKVMKKFILSLVLRVIAHSVNAQRFQDPNERYALQLVEDLITGIKKEGFQCNTGYGKFLNDVLLRDALHAKDSICGTHETTVASFRKQKDIKIKLYSNYRLGIVHSEVEVGSTIYVVGVYLSSADLPVQTFRVFSAPHLRDAPKDRVDYMMKNPMDRYIYENCEGFIMNSNGFFAIELMQGLGEAESLAFHVMDSFDECKRLQEPIFKIN